ncbi:hypothetical protein Golax_025873 [Gossypium laxum]|uniref:Uncharacterized protein n=1 Tax=Gossypium laxum TaxID=34288 RepID=A0A7J9B0P0_9ROSI|nr:hypothetical protein [Gossypium laxum]
MKPNTSKVAIETRRFYSSWQTYLGVYRVFDIVQRDVSSDNKIKSKLEVASHCYNIGSVSLSIFMSSSEPPVYIPTFNETPYEDPANWSVILDEFLQNPNIWHVRVPLINYATVEMH